MAAPLNPEHVPHTTRPPDPGRAARDRLQLARIREGDTAAFDRLFCAYRDDLGAFVTHIVRSREAAEEIVHDLFLRLWESRDLWEFEGVFRAYLFRAARNRAISYPRHERADLRLRDRLARQQYGQPPARTESTTVVGADSTLVLAAFSAPAAGDLTAHLVVPAGDEWLLSQVPRPMTAPTSNKLSSGLLAP